MNPVQFHSVLHGERPNETTPGLNQPGQRHDGFDKEDANSSASFFSGGQSSGPSIDWWSVFGLLLLCFGLLTGYWKWSNSSSSHLETRPSLTLPVQQANVSLQPTGAERVEYFQLPIQEIQVGMRVPAHNPLISDEQRAAFNSSIDPTSWRKFSLDVEKADGTGNVRVTVLRPSSWLVEEVEATAMALVELGLEEAEQHWNQLQDWEKVLVRLDLSISTAVRRCLSGDPTIWDTPVVPLMNTRVLDTNGSMVEAHLEAELDEEYLAEVAEVQAGAGVGSVVFLDLPEVAAIGLATVSANHPLGQYDRPLNYVDGEYLDPATWKKVTLLSPRDDGSETTVTLLRSPRWIRDSIQLASGKTITKIDGHLIGKSIEIVVPEIALAGPARILSIEDCPRIVDGPGEIVTGTFHTNRAKVMDLQFSGQSDVIGVTAEHPFWSETRQQFVPAGELEVGEEALALNGQRTYLSSISPRDGPESVYNFEVANQHVYYVSRDGLLVHNAVYIMKGRTKITGSSYKEALYNSGRTLTVEQAKRLGSAIHGHHIVMKGAFRRSPEMRRVLVESRKILHRAGIRGRHNLANMTFARNGDHSLAYANSVLAKLRQGEALGDVRGALDAIAKELLDGKLFRFGGY